MLRLHDALHGAVAVTGVTLARTLNRKRYEKVKETVDELMNYQGACHNMSAVANRGALSE